MKNFLFIFTLCIASINSYSQDLSNIKVTKELICKGAAISVLGNVRPFFERDFSKIEIIEMTMSLVKDPIKNAPSKAYDLLKEKKTSDAVIDILYNDFMKLDEKTVFKGLINCEDDD